MEDPIQRHPTRQEQLDILATILGDLAAPNDRLLDLGCGTGYFAHLLRQKAPELAITGVDMSKAALNQASEQPGFDAVVGDLRAPAAIALPHSDYAFACSNLTFHDLNDDQKRGVIEWLHEHLRDDGIFFLFDRVRLTAPGLFAAQQSIWRRLEHRYGRGMRTAQTFEAYIEDLGTDNRPAPLETYFEWFREAGFDPACLHLHGNVALIGAKAEQ
ncbi:MAG: class I SAM-dependent methyltransferase [Pseudomonadota bacterium]